MEKDSLSNQVLKLDTTDAEQGLLAILLINPRELEVVSDYLKAEDFFQPGHGVIYQTMLDCDWKLGNSSWVAIKSILQGHPIFEAVGGIEPYLADLLALNFALPSNLKFYAERIIDFSTRRGLLTTANRIMDMASTPDPERIGNAVIEDAEALLYELAENREADAGPKPISAGVNAALEAIDAACKGLTPGIKTGIAALDAKIKALKPGRLYVLGGRTSMGKTALALSIAHNVAKEGHKPLYFSLEMTSEELVHRLIARETGISVDDQQEALSLPRQREAMAAAAKIKSLPIKLDDQAGLTIAQIRTRTRRAKRTSGVDVVFVDHLTLLGGGDSKSPMTYQIGKNTLALKNMAKEFGVPIVLLAQVNRGVEDRDNKRPSNADLKDSGSIEQDADAVMFVFREEYYISREGEPERKPNEGATEFQERLARWHTKIIECKDKAEIIITKNRGGTTGFITVAFDGDRQSFHDLPGDEYRYTRGGQQ